MVQTLIDYIPAYDRIEALFDRWYDRHPSHRTAPTLSTALRARLRTARESEPRSPYQLYTPATIAACIKAMRRGESVGSIHRRTAIAENTLRRWGHDAGLTFARRLAPAWKKAEALRRIAAAEAPAQIAADLRLDPSTISRWGRSAGYKFSRGLNPRLIQKPATAA